MCGDVKMSKGTWATAGYYLGERPQVVLDDVKLISGGYRLSFEGAFSCVLM